MKDLPERARVRIREEMARRHLSQQEVADLLQWTQSRVAQKLTGRTPITLEELESLCFAVGIPATEAVRDHGLEFCAEMTPSEMRLLQQFRQLAAVDREAYAQILGVAARARVERRGATSGEKKIPRGRSG